MGDPFTVAASTTGFLSLGLQVCGGLIKIFRAWKSHDEDVEETLERLNELEATLRSLSSFLSTVENLDSSTAGNLREARQRIRACETTLNRLYGILLEFQSIAEPAGILDRVHNVRLRSMSLFSKERVGKVRTSVFEIQSNLASTMQILSLDMTFQQNSALKNLVTDCRDRIDQVPVSVENTLIKHFELYGERFNALQQNASNVSLQNTRAIQNLTDSITALQLGLIRKPSLIQSASEESRRLQSQYINRRPRPLQNCTCRYRTDYKAAEKSRFDNLDDSSGPERLRRGSFVRILKHRRECPFFAKSEETKQFGYRVSYSGWFLNGTIEAVFSMTRGFGGRSISPILTFMPTIPSKTGAFKIIDLPLKHYPTATSLKATLDFKIEQLSRVFQEGKGSPLDLDENGNTVLHTTCEFFQRPKFDFTFSFPANHYYEIMFEFLRSLHRLGVPLNITNVDGLTPLEILSQMYLGRNYKNPQSLTQCITMMINIGAEFERLPLNIDPQRMTFPLSEICRECTRSPELVEALGCNEICQAIIAKSLSWFMAALCRNPESVDEKNVLGQTALHFSVTWPKSMQLLFDAGANVDASDNFGLTPIFYAAHFGLLEPLIILQSHNCALQTFPFKATGYNSKSFLEVVIGIECSNGLNHIYPQSIFYESIRTVVPRLRKLESIAKTMLDASDLHELQLSSEKILDNKCSLAMSKLIDKIEIPRSLQGLTPSHSTVFHIPDLNIRQACLLWECGFRDVVELDSWGKSAIMISRSYYYSWSLDKLVEIVEWLISKGADLHCRQLHLYRRQPSMNIGFEDIYKSCGPSDFRAVHYLAANLAYSFWYEVFYRSNSKSSLETLIERAKRLFVLVLNDSVCI